MFLFNFSVYTLDRVVLRDIDTAEVPASTPQRSTQFLNAAEVARAQIAIRPIGGWIGALLPRLAVPKTRAPVPGAALPARPAVPRPAPY